MKQVAITETLMKPLIVAAGLTLLCLLGTADLPAQPAAPKSAAEPVRIVLLVDEIRAIRNFPALVAERLGYLNGDGIVVTMMNIRNEAPTADMLMDGRIDAVMAYYHHNIVNRSQGRDFEAIVTLGVTPGAKVLVANQAKDRFKSVADLKGSRIIAGGDGSSKTAVANALLLAGGHHVGDYTRIRNESKDKIVAMLRAGEADLVVAPIPDGDDYESLGLATEFADLTTVEGTHKHLGTLFPTSTVYMRSERVKAHPEIAQHLATAFVRTLQWINSHTPEEVAAVIPPDVMGKDRAAYLKVLKEEIPMFKTDGRMPQDGAQNEWRVLSEANPKYKSVRVSDTYTDRFVDAALETLHVK
jgi:NitT/TauT family transport system substrate-binding protein